MGGLNVETMPGYGPGVIFLPGILARSREQAAPVYNVLRGTGKRQIDYCDYAGSSFDPKQCIADLAGLLDKYVAAGRPATLIGLSLGGMLSAHALTKLASREGLKAILGDAPGSYRDVIMWPLPEFMNLPALAGMNHLHPRERANTSYGRFLLEKLFVNAPEEDAIEVPSDQAMLAWLGQTYSREDWIKNVDRWAREGLSGHLFTQWWGQVRWMLSQDSAPLGGLNLLDTFVRCTRKNKTVRQEAAEHYRPAVGRVVDVKTAHVAILEASTTWNLLLDELL